MKPTNITQWNVTYQKQLKGDWMASASYIGNKTSHLWLGYDMNAATPVAGIPISDITDRRPLYRARPADGALIGNLLMLDDGANANYNGLLFSLQHRFNHGFTLLSNYTWSHCLSDGDSVGNLRQGITRSRTTGMRTTATATTMSPRFSTRRLSTSARLWGKASPARCSATGSLHRFSARRRAWPSTSAPGRTIREAAILRS